MKYILQSKIQYKILILVLKIYSIYFSKIYRMKKNIVVKFCELIGYIKTSWKCLVNIWSKLPCFELTFKASQLPSNLQSIAMQVVTTHHIASLAFVLLYYRFALCNFHLVIAFLHWVSLGSNSGYGKYHNAFCFCSLSFSVCVCVWIYHFHCILLPVVEQGQEH